MVTVQHLVKQELNKNLILVDVLQQELVNISAVATKIEPSISKELKKKVKVSAISMAIRRISEDLKTKKIFKYKFPDNLEISTKTNIYEVAIESTPNLADILKEIEKTIKKSKGEFISIVEGTYEIVIFTNQTNKKYVKEAIKNQKITSELNNIAYVTVNWKKLTKDIPGIYYRITRALAFKDISIQAFHTIGAEMMMFFKDDVFLDAYRTIVALLHNKNTL